MSDARLRELARRWQVSGDVADEAALLVARIRSGTLLANRARLAALLGHPAARTACSDAALELPTQSLEDLEAWCRALPALGHDVCVRVAVAAASRVLDRWEKRCPDRTAPREALDAARVWLECPCAPHAAQAESRGEQCNRIADHERRASHGAVMAALAAGAAARLTAKPRGEDALHTALGQVQAAYGAGTRGRDRLFSELRKALLPWALADSGG